MKIKISVVKLILITSGILFIAGYLAYLLWNPGPETLTSFDIRSNGIWVGHKWYSGYNVRTGKAVTKKEMGEFVALLKRNHIKYAYIHSGSIDSSGSIQEYPGTFFTKLRNRTPEIIYLPWLGGNANKLQMEDKKWRSGLIATLGKLHGYGFNGIHLDIEPIRNSHSGYIELLKEIRNAFDGDFYISHATRRVAPWGLGIPLFNYNFWSKEFYRATMQYADQTVLMAYDTCIKFEKVYISYVKLQTTLLVKWASMFNDHTVLIGIPSYEDVPAFSDPDIENIKNASMGIRSALEDLSKGKGVFKGVSIYANWVTDTQEWKQYRNYWIKPVKQ